MGSVDEIIRNLRMWRALPGYSVERRLDVLLTPFLAGFLSERMGAPVELITAEFPIPKSLLPELMAGQDPKAQHLQADFLCVRRGRDPAWILVELKTDAASKRTTQDAAYVELAAHQTMAKVREALSEVKSGNRHGREYNHITARVRWAARGADRIEVCYLEPLVGKGTDRAETVCCADAAAPAVVWRLGLGRLAGHIPRDDAFGRILQKVLRGIARSDKARRVSKNRARSTQARRAG